MTAALDPALTAAGILVLQLDRDGRVRAASTAAPLLLASTPAELVGRPITELLYTDHAIMADYQLVRGTATTLTTVWRWRRGDGVDLPLVATWQRTDDGWLGVLARASAGDVLPSAAPREAMGHRFAIAERLARVGTFTMELGNGRATWSDTMYELHEWDRRRPVPATQAEYLPIGHPEDIERMFAAALAALSSDSETEVTYRVRRSDGGWRHLFARMIAERDPDGTPQVITGAVRDVSAETEVRTQLIRDRERARDEARDKTRYLAQVTHELRTPLGGVLGMIDLAASDPGPNRSEHLASARASARHLLELIDDLLDASREEAWHINVVAIDFDLRDVVAQAIAMVTPRAKKKQLALDSELGVTTVARRGDPLRLRQVLINLLYNAVKYTARGHVRLAVTASGSAVIFTITDTGVGIPVEQQAVVFEPFVQAHDDDQRREGVGLGLAITRELVSRLGGTIELRSQVGVGTAVTVTLPLPASTGPSSDRLRAIDPGSTPSLVLGHLMTRPLRVLIVEDHPTNAAICQLFLERSGHRSVVVIDGAQAIAAIANDRFDVVLMDLEMPNVDGCEATRRIRADHFARGISRLPIIALSAHKHGALTAASAGMDGYLAKPLDADALNEELARIANGHVRAPIDHAARLAKVGGRAELARAIVETFRSHQPTLCEGIDAALAAGRYDDLRRAAHGLRGALLMVGATEAATLAERLESATLAEAPALRDQVLFEIARAGADLILA